MFFANAPHTAKIRNHTAELQKFLLTDGKKIYKKLRVYSIFGWLVGRTTEQLAGKY